MSLKAASIISWKVTVALVHPKGMTVYSNSPFFVQKVVFHSWPVAMRIRLYSFFKLSLVNHFLLLVLSYNSEKNGKEYSFGIVIRYKAQ